MRSYYPGFDPSFSITAWQADRLLGHALFSPAKINLMGKTVNALALAPIAVVPEEQKRGIGGQLIRFGHDLGRREGFSLVFLLGHPSYYPKHGYKACFGLAKITIDIDKLPRHSQEFHPWPVRPDDIPWLSECLATEWADVDFSWQWGTNLSEWTMPGTNALIWRTANGRRAAYTLGAPGGRKQKMILADDPVLAREVLATVRPATLEQHPSGWLAKNVLEPEWGSAEANSSPAAMAYELTGGVLQSYIAAVETNQRLPGFCNWPLPFMVC